MLVVVDWTLLAVQKKTVGYQHFNPVIQINTALPQPTDLRMFYY